MSTTWNSTIVCASESQLEEIRESASAMLPFVFKERLSIAIFPIPNRDNALSLECSGFRAGHVSMQSWPLELQDCLPPALAKATTPWANLYLAQLSSKVVGRAVWLRYTDITGESAAVTFEDGKVVNADWAITSEGVEEFDAPFLTAASVEIPGVSYIDDVFEKLYEESSPKTQVAVG